jgi:hypothetical protein
LTLPSILNWATPALREDVACYISLFSFGILEMVSFDFNSGARSPAESMANLSIAASSASGLIHALVGARTRHGEAVVPPEAAMQLLALGKGFGE